MPKEFTEKEIKKLRHLLIQEHLVFVKEGLKILEAEMNGMSFEKFKETIQRVTKKRRKLEVGELSFKQQKNVFIGFPHYEYLGLWIMGMFAGSSEMSAEADKVRKLSLTSCKLDELPLSIGNFKNIEYLDLSYNRLTELPEVIRAYFNLEKLYVDHNRIEALPEWIGDLKKMKTFDIGFNFIEELPETFGKLTQLEELFMTQTRLVEIPDWFEAFEDLNWLSIKNTPASFSGAQLEKIGKFFQHKNIQY